MNEKISILCIVSLLLLPGATHAAATSGDSALKCTPTRQDYLGPFYTPDAPVRSKVGQGYILSGTVQSAADCSAISGAKIEIWLVGPNGRYDDDHRATLFTDETGNYRFESNFPPGYSGRPPHIHILVSAPGFRTLVTQHYPKSGENEAHFALVLSPIKSPPSNPGPP